ncbi:sensor histidine kinase [Methanobacterium sp.]|uniref:sensor histidine kinase n=1 Tax=Methanobacterium sp. TaxID=2164 RepID=UPI003C77B192
MELKWTEPRSEYKTFFILAFIAFACFLTYYYLSVLKVEVVFSHFYYIPIVLSAIWWKRNGIWVALFFASILILSSWIYPLGNPLLENLLRSLIFIYVSIITIILSEIFEKSQIKLAKSEEKYRLISENTMDVIWVFDPNLLKFTYVSPSVYNLRGYTSEEVLNQSLEEVLTPESYQFVIENLPKTITGILSGDDSLKVQTHMLEQLHKNGSIVPTEVGMSFMVNDEHQITQIIGVTRDITERKLAEEKIKQSLEEKEMLLKEIHHRVKNNLMIISSLLNLQSRYIKDKESKNIFKDSQNRARSMALIHEKLYQAPDLKRIDFKNYIQILSNELFRTYTTDSKHLQIQINAEDIFLDINTAIPLGLIVNELISNSLKYAFPEGKNGVITVDFHYKDNYYEFSVKDNGIGLPKDFDYQNTDTLGLQLVTNLTEQIGGELELNRFEGTSFKIIFKETKII